MTVKQIDMNAAARHVWFEKAPQQLLVTGPVYLFVYLCGEIELLVCTHTQTHTVILINSTTAHKGDSMIHKSGPQTFWPCVHVEIICVLKCFVVWHVWSVNGLSLTRNV